MTTRHFQLRPRKSPDGREAYEVYLDGRHVGFFVRDRDRLIIYHGKGNYPVIYFEVDPGRWPMEHERTAYLNRACRLMDSWLDKIEKPLYEIIP